ncbi:M56 family metallopeptidase [Flavobacterium sp.]|uniref:M56 family metallopeptidase n=1 Tax=Flavobacterium sp. TaxID=239 RepID=UPI001B553BB3|nr:M56 family metallopeptidase [Flavobacterium sp.]MBP6181639.1 peptidase M56 [Flavobacterium sp.]
METLYHYLLKSCGLLVVFYLAYFFLLRKETFFNSNRWFLLAGLFTSISLPLVFFTKIIWVTPTPTTINWSQIPETLQTQNTTFAINWFLVIGIVYGLGIAFLIVQLGYDFYSLKKILKGKAFKNYLDFKCVDLSENIAPFSYFNTIVYNSSLYSVAELENILEHEKIHSEQNHTIDVLISRVFCIVFWFNPFIWLYKKAILLNLEFIADHEASKNISDKKAYQLTLLKITTQENCVAITNHFYQSLIKKRIVMLNKNQSNKKNSWKYAVILPLLGAFLFLFQVKIVAQEKETKLDKIDLTTFKIEKDLNRFSKGKEIYINGEKSNEDELAKLDPNEIESIEVLKNSSKPTILVTTKHLNKPIKISNKIIYIDGIKTDEKELSLLDNNNIDKIDVNTIENTVRITTKNEKPIIIIDGSQTVSNFKIDDIPTDQISSVNVLKGKAAEEKYGSDGKYGAIEINTKNATYSMGKLENTIKKPLLIINGKRAGSQVNIDDINNDAVKSMNVLKGISAIEKYGKDGENGVIEIATDSPNLIIRKIAIGHPIPPAPAVAPIEEVK